VNLDKIFDEVVEKSSFLRWKEDERESKTQVPKQHFRFFYRPVTNMKPEGAGKEKKQYILLDIVYHKSPYHKTQDTIVDHFLIEQDGKKHTSVVTPSLPSLLGDKLTAFAPHTTGIPLSKEMEILKQVYDINNIFDRIDSIKQVRSAFYATGSLELTFREMEEADTDEILKDIFHTSYNFCTHGSVNKEEYETLNQGVSKLSVFVYGAKFREPEAQKAMAKAAYLAQLIKNDVEKIEKYKKATDMTDWTIRDHHFSKINKLKKSNPEAFFYWYQAFSFGIPPSI
jgi:hypothetical protein